ncbi:catechol O-methyltransferase [Pyronema omphalodes]|nr:catechol O-methyltransferase [Pyronema omphalodes]
MVVEFTSKHRYGEQEEVYFNDGRELDLLKHIFGLPTEQLDRLRGNPSAVLEAIDKFAEEKYLMNIGELKGSHVTALITKHKPSLCLELGGYVGYSCILFASCARAANPSAKYYCLEYNPVFGAVIMALVHLAGLEDTVRVIIGSSTDTIKRCAKDGTWGTSGADFIFLDHLKPMYTTDLRLMESLGMVRMGTVIAADNMVKPGNPPYHEWVNADQSKKEELVKGIKGEERGKTGIRYENTWIESWEPQAVPDAIEVSVVVECPEA